ncbi:thaumatin-like protein 1 [Tanacetum coccineum]
MEVESQCQQDSNWNPVPRTLLTSLHHGPVESGLDLNVQMMVEAYSGDCGSGHVGCNGAGGAPPATLAEFTIGATDCPVYINANCPSELAVKNGSGGTVGCKSACEVFGTPEYCCSGDHNTPDKCPPTDYSRNRNGATDCPVYINANCPSELAVKNGSGGTVGCKSACEVFGTPEYCCSGDHNTPDKCPPTDYSRFFKNLCPKAYSYAYDDSTSTFTCNTGTNYVITFCP